MKKPAILLVLVLLFSLTLYACGGGGGGGTTGGATKSTVTIGGTAVGTVGITSLVGTSKAGVTKSAADGDLVGGAKVKIETYHNGVLDKTYETVTDKELGTFSSQIELWSDGGYIVVSVEKDGLVKYSKTFNYKKPEDLKGFNLKAELAPYLTKVVSFENISTTNFFKSAEDDVLSIAIVQDSSGVKKLATNNEIKVAKASGGVVKWQMDLSKSMLKAASDDMGNSILIKAQNFNPKNQEDMKSFPADSDTSGNKLVSTGFDFIDIKTATGKSFCIDNTTGLYGTLDSSGKCQVSASSASKQSSVRKSAVVTFRVKRQIEDCSIFNKDEDSTKPGKQVGFYITRNGKWLKIGNATLYNDDAFGSTYGYVDDTKYATACTESNKPYAILTDEEIKKASEDLGFDLSWHNFDYVALGDLKTFCIEGEFKKVKKNEKSALSGLYLWLNDLRNNNDTVSGFRSASGYTDENGKFKIEGVTTAIDANYHIYLSFTDPFTYKWITKDKTLKAKAASGCYQVDLEEVTDPFECSVTGRATKKSDGSAYSNKYLYTYVKDKWYGYKYSYTDSEGLYTIPVICDEDYILTNGVDSFEFKVNKNKEVKAPELDDTSKQVVLNPVFPNHKPYVYAYANQYSIKTGETVQLSAYAWDPDGDAVTYSWSVSGNAGTFDSTTKQNPKWTAPSSPGTYKVTVTATDTGGLYDSKELDIEVYTGNRPPKISYLYVPFSVVEGDEANLYVSAYDPDGDSLTYIWSVSDNAGTFDSITKQNPKWTAPSVLSKTTYTVTVSVYDNYSSDSAVTDSRTITVYPDNPPVIVSDNIPSIVTPGSVNSISAYAYDPEGKSVTYTWNITNINNKKTTEFSSSFFSWTPADEGDYTVNLTVSDGTKTAKLGEKTISVKKQNTAPVISNFTVPATGGINQPITLSVTATDAENDPLTISFYVDGNLIDEQPTNSQAAKAATVSTTWTPRIRKSYTIGVVVSDGALTAKSSRTFTVTNTAPVITSVNVPSTATAGTAVTLTATATDADGDTLTYEWYIQNVKQTGTGASITWTPSSAGNYTVEVRVSDGKVTTPVTFSKTVTVTGAVTNQPPSIPTINVTPGAGQYTLSAVASDPDNGPSPLTYTWYIDGVSLGTGQTIVWPISSEGTYQVKVVVSDGVATAEKIQSVTVSVTTNVVIQ